MKNKNYSRHVLYLTNGVAYDHDFWYTCVKWWYLQTFFVIFSKFWFFGFFRMVKGQKSFMLHMCKMISPSINFYFSIWLSFMVHMCKMIISPSINFHFSKFWFSGLLGIGEVGGKRAKNSPKWQKFCLSHSISQEP